MPGQVETPQQPPGGGPPPSGTNGRQGLGMSRSVSDTTLRKHALHLNLSQSVLPSFTPLHQFKVVTSVVFRTNRESNVQCFRNFSIN